MHNLRIFIWILIIGPVLQIDAQKSKLTVNLESGFSYETEITSSISFVQEFMGISYTTDTRISNVIISEVTDDHNNSGFILKSNYKHMSFSMKSLMIDLEMSSDSKNMTNPMNIMMKSLVGKPFYQTISSEGKLADIQGLDELIQQQLEKINLPEEQKAEFRQNFLDSFGEKALTDITLQNSIVYCDSAFDVGDSWFRSLTIKPYGIPMHLMVNVSVKEISDGYATFIAEGTLAARKISVQDETATSTITYDLAGTEVSEIKIDLTKGLIVKSISTQFIHGKVNTSDKDTPGKVIEIPLKINSRTALSSK